MQICPAKAGYRRQKRRQAESIYAGYWIQPSNKNTAQLDLVRTHMSDLGRLNTQIFISINIKAYEGIPC